MSAKRVAVLYEDADWLVTGVPRRWWRRTYAVPRWLVWLALPQLALGFLRGLVLIVSWVS